MTIAGSDSGGGAGIQADLKTFALLGVYGTSALTAVTAQNTAGVFGVVELPAEFVAQQIDVVADDIGIDAAKTGMLASAAIVAAVAERVAALGIAPLVVDPVMISTSGARLLAEDAVETLKRRLLPLATLVTPNLAEAAALCGREVATLAEMEAAARAIHDLGPKAVLIKGGHLPGEAADLFFDGQTVTVLRAPRIDTASTHGTGCVLSAAITALLAQGVALPAAVAEAKEFVTAALRAAAPLGRGHGPVDPLAWWRRGG